MDLNFGEPKMKSSFLGFVEIKLECYKPNTSDTHTVTAYSLDSELIVLFDYLEGLM